MLLVLTDRLSYSLTINPYALSYQDWRSLVSFGVIRGTPFPNISHQINRKRIKRKIEFIPALPWSDTTSCESVERGGQKAWGREWKTKDSSSSPFRYSFEMFFFVNLLVFEFLYACIHHLFFKCIIHYSKRIISLQGIKQHRVEGVMKELSL